MQFLVSSFSNITQENTLSSWAFDIGRVSNLMTPSAKSLKCWFPPASWNASTSSQKASMAWSLEKPADAMFLHWLSKVSTEQDKNSSDKTVTPGLFNVDITSVRQKSSSLWSISIDAVRRIWYYTSTSFRKSKQCAEIVSFSSVANMTVVVHAQSAGLHNSPQCHVQPVMIPKNTQRIPCFQLEIFVHSFDFHQQGPEEVHVQTVWFVTVHFIHKPGFIAVFGTWNQTEVQPEGIFLL